jgi:phage-related protein
MKLRLQVAAIGRERLKAVEKESRQRKQQQRTLEFGNGYDQTHPTGPSSSQSNLQLSHSHQQNSDEPMIAPSKLLMAKRKVTQFESLILPANNSKSANTQLN